VVPDLRSRHWLITSLEGTPFPEAVPWQMTVQQFGKSCSSAQRPVPGGSRGRGTAAALEHELRWTPGSWDDPPATSRCQEPTVWRFRSARPPALMSAA